MAGNMVRLSRRCQPAKRTSEAARALGISRPLTNTLLEKIIPKFSKDSGLGLDEGDLS